MCDSDNCQAKHFWRKYKIQNTKNACLDGDCTIVFESLTTRGAATEKQKEFKLCPKNCVITFSYILQKGFDLFDKICLIGFHSVYPKWVSGFVANRPAPDYGKGSSPKKNGTKSMKAKKAMRLKNI